MGSPSLLPLGQVQRLDGLLGTLLGGEARPFVPAVIARGLRLLEVVFRLGKPISGT